MTRMEKFNKCSAEIFSLLYENFPVVTDIQISNFPEYDNAENSKIFNATVDFLDSEGFIKKQDKIYGSYLSVVLTSKGLTVLNSLPEAISGNETLGDKVKDVLRTGQDEGIKAVIGEIFRFFVQ